MRKFETLQRSATIVICMLFIGFSALRAQCPPPFTQITSQAQIDAFATDYPNCTQIPDLWILGNNSDITSLAGLSQVTALTGGIGLYISNIDATSLSGLENITSVTGEGFACFSNSLLTDISALDNMTMNVSDYFDLSSNPLLQVCDYTPICDAAANFMGITDFSGNGSTCTGAANIIAQCNALPLACENITLSSQLEVNNFTNDYSCMTSVDGFLEINGADITDLTPLNGLTTINGSLRILNTALTDLTGLSNLSTIDLDPISAAPPTVEISGNTALTSLIGLENISSIPHPLVISNNAALSSLAGLSTVGFLNDLTIETNPALAHLDDFTSLLQIATLDLNNNASLSNITGLENVFLMDNAYINDNPNLSTCDITILCDQNVSSIVDIANNATGCNSEVEILNVCNGSFPVAVGIADQCNSVPGLMLSGVGYVPILDSNGDIVCSIDPNGNNLGMTNVSFFSASATRTIGGIPYMNRNIAITPTNQANLPVNLTLYFTAAEYQEIQLQDPNVTAPADIKIAKESGTCHSAIGYDLTFYPTLTAGFYGTAGDVYVEISVGSFSDFYGFGTEYFPAIAPGTTDVCETIAPQTLSGSDYIDIFDASGNILCSVDPNGNNLGMTTFGLFTTNTNRLDESGNTIMNRNISISPTTQPTGNLVNVKLYFTDAELQEMIASNILINSITDILIAKQDGGCHTTIANSNMLQYFTPISTGTHGTNGDVYFEIQIVGFSDFFGTAESQILPVNWLSNLKCYENATGDVDLEWTTASHVNHFSFEIEHSIDGRNYTSIHTDEDAYSLSAVEHSYTHNTPSDGVNYYRVKQNDVDGKYDFSNIATITLQDERTIFPNPVREFVQLQSELTGQIKIINVYGATVRTLQKVDNMQTIQTADLPDGLYIILLNDEMFGKFIKE